MLRGQAMHPTIAQRFSASHSDFVLWPMASLAAMQHHTRY